MKKINLFDTHTHYNVDPLFNNYQEYLNDDYNNNILVNIIGTDIDDSKKAIMIAKENKNALCSIAIHPNNISSMLEIKDMMNELELLYLDNKDVVIAIGECGLDYYLDNIKTRDIQIELFNKHIELATKYKLPIILHVRDAHDDVINILSKHANELEGIIIHCYTGNLEQAIKYQSMGCYISFSGIITFKKSNELREIVKSLNIDKIISETDSPYLSPEPLRGKINISKNLAHINQCIANIRNLEISELNKIILSNSLKALKLDINRIIGK